MNWKRMRQAALQFLRARPIRRPDVELEKGLLPNDILK
jgi:hypothetical protein